MTKKLIQDYIYFYIDKELSYKEHERFSLVSDFKDNFPQISLAQLDEALQELIDQGEVVMYDGDCGTDTLIVSAFKPNTAMQILKDAGIPIPNKLRKYWNDNPNKSYNLNQLQGWEII